MLITLLKILYHVVESSQTSTQFHITRHFLCDFDVCCHTSEMASSDNSDFVLTF